VLVPAGKAKTVRTSEVLWRRAASLATPSARSRWETIAYRR